MKNNATIADYELSRKLLDFQFRLIEKRYGRLAVQFAKTFVRGELNKERLVWIEVFFIILYKTEKTFVFCNLLYDKFRNRFPILFDNLLVYEVCLLIARGVLLLILIILGAALFSFELRNLVPGLLVTLLHFFGWVYKYRRRPAKCAYLLLGQCISVSLFAVYFGWTAFL